MKTKILAIVGPTASGKTALSIELAKKYNGEIISCDSMQIYKRMDIGTAKPTFEEMSGIVHHMIDVVEPTVEYSCADYVAEAKKKIDEISNKGKLPIFCGGTGLYIENIIHNTIFSEAGSDDEYRDLLKDELNRFGPEYLHEKLKKIDAQSAENIHPNNVKRVIRALEIFKTTGKTKTEWDNDSKSIESPYDCTMIFLDFKDREVLYDRINRRVDIMLENGLLDEVKLLYSDDSLILSNTAKQGIGYKELFDYFDGKCSLEEAVEAIKQGSRNYAKRQLTWFRRYKNAHVVYVDECMTVSDLIEKSNLEIKP